MNPSLNIYSPPTSRGACEAADLGTPRWLARSARHQIVKHRLSSPGPAKVRSSARPSGDSKHPLRVEKGYRFVENPTLASCVLNLTCGITELGAESVSG